MPARRKPKQTRPAKPPCRSPATREETLAALKAESARRLEELIRRLALPIEERMNFLRRRLPGGGSCL
jgi:hypothetical protein